jgi:hypothetical protein
MLTKSLLVKLKKKITINNNKCNIFIRNNKSNKNKNV